MTETANLDLYLDDPTRTGVRSYDQAIVDIDASVSDLLEIDASTYATPYTIPYGPGDLEPKVALRFIKIRVTGVLAATWTAYVPAKRHFFIVENGTTGGHDIIVQVAGLTGVTVAAATMALCYNNGVDVEEIATAGGGGSGTVTSVATGTGLTGGPVTTAGTIALAAIADADLLANTSGGSAAPVPTTLSALIDYAIGSTRGQVLYRGASGWAALATGTSGNFLTTNGVGADPTWSAGGSGTVTSVATGTGLTGGTITSTGTIALAAIANHDLLANTSGGSAAPVATTLTALIDDAIGSTQGDILYRSGSGWVVLAPGTANFVLTTHGAAADPTWEAAGSGTVTSVATGTGLTGGTITATGTIALAAIANHDLLANTSGSSAAPVATTLTALIDNAIGSTQGDILYRSATVWTVLAPGTSGQVLETQGAAANPIWETLDLSSGSTTGTLGHGKGGTGTTSYTDGQLLIGNTSTTGLSVHTLTASTGITVTNGSGTITLSVTTNGVTNALLAQMATHTIKGNKTGGTANAADLSGTDVTALLDDFVGDSGLGGTAGLVPAPAAGDAAASKFLAADGTWAAPAGAGTVTSVATGTGLTGGPITGSGTIALAAIANHDLLANTSGGSAAPVATTLTALIDDAIGSTQGDILYRNATVWTVLAPGTSGWVLQSGGAGANPSWVSAGGTGTVTSVAVSSTDLSVSGSPITSSGTIALDVNSNAITNAKLATMATHTIKGNATGGTANPTDLTGTATTALLDPVVGDTGTGGTQGLVPAPASGDAAAGKFLKADGTWATVSGAAGGTVTSVATGTGLTGGTITSTGTIALAAIANHDLLANTSGGSAAPVATTLTALIDDALGSTQGDILYRNGTVWTVLAPGTSGWFLASGGASANPSWTAAGSVTSVATGTGLTGGTITGTGTISLAAIADHDLLANTSGGSAAPVATTLTALIDNALGSTRGNILYRNATVWTVLAPGTSGQFLETLGAGADPAWASNPFDISCYYGTSVLTSLNIGIRFTANRTISFAANFGTIAGGTSHATASVAATGSTVFNVDKAASGSENTWSTIGTVTYASSGVTATFATTGGTTQSLAAGDSLRIIAPSTPDATLSGVSITLAGAR